MSRPAHKTEAVKPYRTSSGIPWTHAELEQHWAANAKTRRRLDPRDPGTRCLAPLEHRGFAELDNHGHSYVDWYGDALHVEVYCPEHGPVSTVETDYAAVFRGEQRHKTTTKEATS